MYSKDPVFRLQNTFGTVQIWSSKSLLDCPKEGHWALYVENEERNNIGCVNKVLNSGEVSILGGINTIALRIAKLNGVSAILSAIGLLVELPVYCI